MKSLAKCLLLPIDGSPESMRPIEFVNRLYPGVSDISLILSYFVPPVPPVYSAASADSPALIKKRRDALASRDREARRIFENAKAALIHAGFSQEFIQEHVQHKQMTVARHACLLADTKKVDAILVQKKVSSSLEGFLRGESTSALLEHCLSSPVWFTDGDISVGNGAVCINNEPASLRVADHAAFMLADTGALITLLHVGRSLSGPVSCALSEVDGRLSAWSSTTAGMEVMPYVRKAGEICMDNGVEKDRIRVVVLPHRNDPAAEIMSWCTANRVGIVGLGHSQPQGIWSFLKASVTRRILDEFRNMAIWVAQ